jgi:site-specific recombinase XerD
MKPAIESIEQISVEPHTTAPTDPWRGISEDVIRRFVDVLCAEHALPKGLLSTYRADLDSLDRWLMETKQRTLVTATDEDVREYISVSLSCLRAFYGFLVNAGCRDDDPTEPGRAPRSQSALQRDREH